MSEPDDDRFHTTVRRAPEETKLLPCPIETAKYGSLAVLYRDCPNRRAPSVATVLEELAKEVEGMLNNGITVTGKGAFKAGVRSSASLIREKAKELTR